MIRKTWFMLYVLYKILYNSSYFFVLKYPLLVFLVHSLLQLYIWDCVRQYLKNIVGGSNFVIENLKKVSFYIWKL